jgi:hypothetical protein
VYCTDVRELIRRTCDARGIDESEIALTKLGMDSGQGSLKAAISLLTEEDLMPGISEILAFPGEKRSNCIIKLMCAFTWKDLKSYPIFILTLQNISQHTQTRAHVRFLCERV